MILSGWGRYPRAECHVSRPRDEAGLRAAVAQGGAIARGNGRAYGDSAMSAPNTLDMRAFDRLIAFDPATGQLVAEAGVMLGDIIAAFLPRGWFPMVTPGTRFVTLGGMIAADVHGKNHHRIGAMRACLDWVEVMGADGTVTRHAPGSEGFDWTVGGMGLTGIILRAALRLRAVESAWISQTLIPAPDLGAAMDLFDAHDNAPYSVAWIDCLATGPAMGRALLMLGEHTARADLPRDKRAAPFTLPRRRRLTMPLDLPGFALSPLTVRAFNAAYYRAGLRKAGASLIDWERYFYPLDAILGWNRIYGRRGFVQFQCALPHAAARAGLTALLREIAASGQGSFLSVLKRFGAEAGPMSFPMPGYTLALDFPVNARTLALLPLLDAITLDHGGRFYLAKDARVPQGTFHAADPRAAAFRAWRRAAGLAPRFASAQSERLDL